MNQRKIGIYGSTCLLLSVTGCYPGVPKSRIPGTYSFSRSGYVTHLTLSKDGKSVQVRQAPDGSSKTLQSRWQIGPLEDHITVTSVLPFYPEEGISMDLATFYTPETDILWGRVCLLVDGNKDLYMCKQS